MLVQAPSLQTLQTFIPFPTHSNDLNWKFFLSNTTNNATYRRSPAGRNCPRSIRVCSGRSRTRWSCRYTGRCGWSSGWATARDRPGRRAGTGARAGASPPRCWRTVRAPCWSHMGRWLVLRATGSTVRSGAPRRSRTPGGIERSRPRRPRGAISAAGSLSPGGGGKTWQTVLVAAGVRIPDRIWSPGICKGFVPRC